MLCCCSGRMHVIVRLQRHDCHILRDLALPRLHLYARRFDAPLRTALEPRELSVARSAMPHIRDQSWRAPRLSARCSARRARALGGPWCWDNNVTCMHPCVERILGRGTRSFATASSRSTRATLPQRLSTRVEAHLLYQQTVASPQHGVPPGTMPFAATMRCALRTTQHQSLSTL